MIGSMVGQLLDSMTPSSWHPFIDGGISIAAFAEGDPMDGITEAQRALGEAGVSVPGAGGGTQGATSLLQLADLGGGSTLGDF